MKSARNIVIELRIPKRLLKLINFYNFTTKKTLFKAKKITVSRLMGAFF